MTLLAIPYRARKAATRPMAPAEPICRTLPAALCVGAEALAAVVEAEDGSWVLETALVWTTELPAELSAADVWVTMVVWADDLLSTAVEDVTALAVVEAALEAAPEASLVADPDPEAALEASDEDALPEDSLPEDWLLLLPLTWKRPDHSVASLSLSEKIRRP